MKKKQIIIAGCVHIHLPAFIRMLKEASDRIEVTGCWDNDSARARAAALELGTDAVDSLDALLRKTADAVVICSETSRHREILEKSAAAGKHLFVEKPLGFSADDAIRMAKTITEAGLLFQTGYFMRGNPHIQFLRGEIGKGTFGTITHVRFSNCHAGALKGWFDSDYRWMADTEKAGCGAFGDLGTHILDLILWLFGMPDSVHAEIRTVTARYGASCDEHGDALLTFPSGLSASMSAGWVSTANPAFCEIHGTKATAVIFNGKLYFQSEDRPDSDCTKPYEGPLPEAMPHAFQLFLDALCGKDVPLVSAAEAADRNVVMEALYRSAQKHEVLRLNEKPRMETSGTFI